MAEEKKSLIAPGLFPDVMAALASGVCIGLSQSGGVSKPTMTIAMQIDETERPGNLTADGPFHVILSDATALRTSPVDYTIEGVCQTCTLQVTIDTGIQIQNRGPNNVKVHLTHGCNGWPTIVIRS